MVAVRRGTTTTRRSRALGFDRSRKMAARDHEQGLSIDGAWCLHCQHGGIGRPSAISDRLGFGGAFPVFLPNRQGSGVPAPADDWLEDQPASS